MIIGEIKNLIQDALEASHLRYEEELISLERPKNEEFGDVATPLALKLAKLNKKSPMELAEQIVNQLPKNDIFESVSIAKPGFINFKYSSAFLHGILRQLLKQGDAFLRSDIGRNKKVILEYVSANPTGPLHIGHGRGAAFGDSLANIMEFCGFDVYREYYINDAGNQMRILGRSLLIRLLQLKGYELELPKDHYQGDYIKTFAAELADDPPFADAKPEWLEQPEKISEFSAIAKREIMDMIEEDLSSFRVKFDNFFSELRLHKTGKIRETIEFLKQRGLIEERDGALWFKASEFGDDKDRVLVRSSGEPTYFAADIAYHRDKFERGFDIAIDIWGQDHHGYVKRLKTAIELLGYNKTFDIILYQLVALKGFKLSTRKGEFITLKELVDEVGSDPVRFFFVMRSHNSHLDFDVELAKSQSNENPVYYVQYAHARINSIFKKYGKPLSIEDVDLSLLKEKELLDLIKEIIFFQNVLITAAQRYEVHLLPHFLLNVAARFHRAYNLHRVITDNEAITKARLAAIKGVQILIKTGLNLLGVNAPEEM